MAAPPSPNTRPSCGVGVQDEASTSYRSFPVILFLKGALPKHDPFRLVFEEVADIASVLFQDLIVRFRDARLFPSATPNSLNIWAEAELGWSSGFHHVHNASSLQYRRLPQDRIRLHPHTPQRLANCTGAQQQQARQRRKPQRRFHRRIRRRISRWRDIQTNASLCCHHDHFDRTAYHDVWRHHQRLPQIGRSRRQVRRHASQD